MCPPLTESCAQYFVVWPAEHKRYEFLSGTVLEWNIMWLWCGCAQVSGRVTCLTSVQQNRNFSVNIWEEQHGGSQVVTLSLRHTSCLFTYWGHKTGHANLTVGITATLCYLPFLWSHCMQTVIGWTVSPRHGTSSRCGWRYGLQTRWVAANILNKQSRTADKGWSSRFVVLGEVVTTPHSKNWSSY